MDTMKQLFLLFVFAGVFSLPFLAVGTSISENRAAAVWAGKHAPMPQVTLPSVNVPRGMAGVDVSL